MILSRIQVITDENGRATAVRATQVYVDKYCDRCQNTVRIYMPEKDLKLAQGAWADHESLHDTADANGLTITEALRLQQPVREEDLVGPAPRPARVEEVAEVRAQAIVDTLRWLQGEVGAWFVDVDWLSEELRLVTNNLEEAIKTGAIDDCCPLCHEVDCDEGCPLRPLRLRGRQG